MSAISEVTSQIASTYKTSPAQKTDSSKETDAAKKSKVSGKTIGEPQLTDKGKQYYEQLKAKYSNLDFILVSSDMKETAKAQSASYANPNKMVVLIDEEKIEKMAEDEKFRSQYEDLIQQASTALPELKSAVGSNPNVKSYGMQVSDNGTAQYFAVLEKSGKAQAERLEKKAAEKKEAKKAEEKKAAKEEAASRLEERREASKSDKAAKSEKADSWNTVGDDDVVITAGSIEELVKKLQDYSYMSMSDNVMTEAEKAVGGNFDLRL